MFSYRFDVLISKINFKKIKKILFVVFLSKKHFENNYYYNTKQALSVHEIGRPHYVMGQVEFFLT
jgi:hypothetical protein